MATTRPKEIWVIFDPMDGPHVFRSERQAREQFRQWELEAKDKEWDSFWQMSKPTVYTRI